MKKLFTSMKFQLAVGSTLLFASCAQTIDPKYAMTKDEMQTMKQLQISHTADGAMAGALTGAALGAGTAALTGGDVKKAAIGGGVAGALGGGMLGFDKGDKAGKQKVALKRSRQVIEKDIKETTAKYRSFTALADLQIKRLRLAQKEGASSETLKKQAQKFLAENPKFDGANPFKSDFLGMSGSEELKAAMKEKTVLTATLNSIAKDGNVQKM